MRARKGRQAPTFEQVGDFDSSDGKQAAALASEFWGKPLRWQRHLLDVMCARDARDRYMFKTVAVSVPRQNGKSWSIRARCFYGLVADGERILFTCQHGDTADEMFKALCEPFEDEDNDELRGILKAIRKTNGQQAIYLGNGGYIRFTTRTNSLARGKSYDVIIYDEAQELTSEQQAASMPTVAAGKKRNPQYIYAGTPSGPGSAGDVFSDMHDKVHDGEAMSIAWVEWSAREIGDPHDRNRWHDTNPSLGYLIEDDTVAAEADQMDAATFARERLGWWSPATKVSTAISRALWKKARIDAIGDAYTRKTAFAVKFSSDGARYALVGCKADHRGGYAVEIVEVGGTEGGTKSLAAELHKRRTTASCVVVDGFSGADALCDNMAELKSPRGYVVRPRTADVIAAATGFLDGLSDGTTKHTGQRDLTDSAVQAVKRPIGNRGGWGFGDGPQVESMAVEAAALAVWGARNSKRNPRRKQRLL